MSTSTMDHFTPSPNEKYYRSSVFPKIKHIFDRILRRCFPKLKENNAFFRPLDGEARKYGDYVCFNVFEICEELRKNNPDLFDERKPKDIAMEIIRELEFENTDMISKHSIQLHDIGVITFKLHGSWIAKRVEKMFNDGIDTCAPVIYESEARAVFLSRTNTQLIPVAADMLRADFIKDALARIFLYSGIDILDAGVSPSNNIFEEGQIIRMFSFLKRHRLVECIFDIDEILNEELSSFMLEDKQTFKMISSNTRGYGKCENYVTNEYINYKSAWVSNWVIEKACAGLVPNFVCDYLYDLSKLFTSYYRKGFSQVEILSSERRIPCRELAETRSKYLNSQFEIFLMTVDVEDLTLDEYDIFRTVWVIDTLGARANGWTMSDENDCCFVTYFKREWHNPVGTFNGSCIPFGDPSCPHSVPVSSFIEVYVLVQVLSKNRDRYYKICYVSHVVSFSDFWVGQGKVKSGTLQFSSNAGLVGLNYILLKEAVDASVELTFSSTSDVSLQVYGSIMAYYGDGVVKDDDGTLGQLKAVLFRTKKSELNGNQVPLEMHKSVLAVPADGCLMTEAFLMDVKTKKVIVDEMMEYHVRPGNADNWCIKYKEYSFNLKVAWSEFTSA
ncbi:arginine--tRNA ligase, chloroplastic/mitochondrial [Tanacetum coccineum]|uniref:Arginine--tRNA ligase, chloroplastic/mitochondrial n=1 Tax=Tanacetum coccineum TaxID=301880 RepID=A0ABQ5EB09_9ASTR